MNAITKKSLTIMAKKKVSLLPKCVISGMMILRPSQQNKPKTAIEEKYR